MMNAMAYKLVNGQTFTLPTILPPFPICVGFSVKGSHKVSQSQARSMACTVNVKSVATMLFTT
eukprot:10358988-Karenia_brevis.AAC.1